MGWQVELDGAECTVLSDSSAPADIVIGTDSETWLDLREGRLSGLDAFRSRRLWARGNLDLAIGFEGFFRLPNGRPPLLRVHEVDAGKAKISTLTAGSGLETAILIHGLGGTKSSFYETVSALASEYTVHAIDLPGFGASSKPARAPYDSAWFSRAGRPLHGRARHQARPPGRQLARRARRDRGRPHRARPSPKPQPSHPVARVAQAPGVRAGREAAPARARRDPAQDERPPRPPPVLEHVRPARAPAPIGRRPRRRGVRRGLPQPRRPGRILQRRPKHLPRGAKRPRRVLRAPLGAAAARDVRLGRRRPARPARLLRPRDRGPARRAPGRPERVRPRAPGRAARGHQRPDRRLHGEGA